ncbi:MAG: glycoside hydrolase family 57 protein, partial [Candidatus Krumholzibacteriia bacterium]
MPQGYFALVLHAHLPFVRHPEYEEFLEEDWFYEAISETYIPLLNVFEGLARDGVHFRTTMSMSPTLLAMLTDDLLTSRYVRHLELLIELAEKEVHRTRHEPHFQAQAQMYLATFRDCHHTFVERWGRNLVRGFRALQDADYLEIMTCGATHGFLPLMETLPIAVGAQVRFAVDDYVRHFGRRPRGIWLPECGYYPGLESTLKEVGLRFFLVDAHGVLFATPRPKYGIFAPLYCPGGVAAFGRDIESSKQVWSAEEGYPGDHNYREFYRDIGFDLDMDYIRPYIHSGDLRINTGIKYYAITGQTPHKRPYRRDVALDTAAKHASNFMFNREKQVEHLHGVMGKEPIVVSPYDAELFGHWWFEGPQFLDYLFRKIHFDQNALQTTTPYEYLQRHPRNQVATPSFSSWGYKGYAEVWLEGSNDWIYRHLDRAARTMAELASAHPDASGVLERALNQAARELLLAQSSDWAFIMKTG